MSLAHVDIELAVEQRYMKGSSGAEQQTALHRLLAAYYMKIADPKLDGSFTGNSNRAFIHLPYHLVSKDIHGCKISMYLKVICTVIHHFNIYPMRD